MSTDDYLQPHLQKNAAVGQIMSSKTIVFTANAIVHAPLSSAIILDIPKEKITSMSNTLVIPEQELARIIAAYGNRTHRVVQVSLRGNAVGAVSPLMVSAGLETGMFPLAVSHDWREDITTITMISI